MTKYFPILAVNISMIFLFGYIFDDIFLCKLDCNAFNTAGIRAFSGQLQNIYLPIEGSGPFAYTPFAIPFFIFMSSISSNSYLILSFVSMQYLIFLFYKFFLENGFSVFRSFAVTISLFFASSGVIWESMFIGQIDFFIAAGLSSIFLRSNEQLIYKGNFKIFLEVSFLVLVVSMKVQFLLMLIIYLVYFSRDYKTVIFYVIFISLSLIYLLYFLTSHDINLVSKLISDYLQNASDISSSIGVTNQSLFATIQRIFFDVDGIQGRYFPSLFLSPPMQRNDLFLIFFMFMILVALIYSIYFYSVSSLHSHAGSKISIVSLMLACLPTITPAFWQVHSIYLLISIVITFVGMIQYNARVYQSFIIILCCYLVSSNFFIVGKYFADNALYFSSTYFVSILIMTINLITIFHKSSHLQTKLPLKNEGY